MNATAKLTRLPSGITYFARGAMRTSMNFRKIKFISYIYILTLHRFLFIICKNFDINRTLRWPVNYCIYLRRRLSVTLREQVSFMDL